ncbi:MAG: type II toxin-antitoxin system RelE/ParE family toxin [Ornithinimicrobium sp.]
MKAHLSESVGRVHAQHERVTVTVHLSEAAAFAAYEFIVGSPLDNPRRVGKRLRPPLADRHSARRGAYRVIYRIDDTRASVTVADVAHRRDVLSRQSRRLTARHPAASRPEYNGGSCSTIGDW